MVKNRFKTSKFLLAMCMIGALLSSMFMFQSVGSAKTIKIMSVGDSCTEGMGDPDMGGYRTELYRLYSQAGLSFDFVGGNKRGPSSLPDKDNEGHSGWTIPQVASNIDNWINTYNPDVILLWIGGNDVLQGRVNTQGLSDLIDQIFRKKPDITLFVSDYYQWPDSVKQYNATIPGVIQQKVAAGKNVHFVKLSDMQFSQWQDLSSDGLHLNTAGYSKIAKIWYDSTISILRQLANGSSSTPAPTPTSNFPQWPNNPTPTPQSGSSKTIKIMPVGDSCTEGMGDPDMGGYRTELYRLYTQAGLSIDYVGGNKRGPSSLPDKDNEGHSGWTIPQVASNIDNWINTYNPDVILLWIGGNDVLQGRVNTQGLSDLIDQIFRKKPDVTLFVSDYYQWPDSVKQYNATIPGVIQQKVAAGKNIHFVKLSDMQFSQWQDLSSDGLHLNTGGYSKIAKIWYDSTITILKQMAGGSNPTPVPTPTSPNNNVRKGDVNGDGDVNSLDFAILRGYLVGRNTLPSSQSYTAADLNNDNSVDSLDFALLRAGLLGKVSL